MPQLIVGIINRDIVINQQEDIEKEICNYYKKLYDKKDSNLKDESIEHFLEQSNILHPPKVSEQQMSSMDGYMRLEELTKYLKKVEKFQ